MSNRPIRPKPTNTVIQQRIDEVWQLRIDGATMNDLRRYLAEKEAAGEQPWTIPDGGKPLSERTLWRYVAASEKIMAESVRESMKRRLRRHLSQRRSLFARAVSQGDMRTALAVLRDEAELLNMYPAKKAELTGANGGPVVLQVVEEIVDKDAAPTPLEGITEEVVTTNDSSNASNPGTDPANHPPAPGSESVPVE